MDPKIRFAGFGKKFTAEEEENRLMGEEDRFLKNAKCRAVAMAKFLSTQIRRKMKRYFELKGVKVDESDVLNFIQEGKNELVKKYQCFVI